MTDRQPVLPERGAVARLSAPARFVRSIEERTTMPRSSTSVTVSSLQEYQSTIRSRFSCVTASTSTPRPRRSERAASGDCDEIRMSPLAPDFRPSARNVRAKRNFSWPGGPCSTTLEPAGRPPWTMASNPEMPVASRAMRITIPEAGSGRSGRPGRDRGSSRRGGRPGTRPSPGLRRDPARTRTTSPGGPRPPIREGSRGLLARRRSSGRTRPSGVPDGPWSAGAPSPSGSQDREAVLPREEPDRLLEGLLIHGRTYLRSAFDATEVYASWSQGVHKLSPGILTCDYCWAEHDNSAAGIRTDVPRTSTGARSIDLRAPALSKVEVRAPDWGRPRPSPPPERSFARGLARGPAMRYTRFEKARIIGARALQISMGSPILIDVPTGVVDPIEIAWIEFNSGAIPITVKRET